MDVLSTISQKTKLISAITQISNIIIDTGVIDDSSLPRICFNCPMAEECHPKIFHKTWAASAYSKCEVTEYKCQETKYFFSTPISELPVLIQESNKRFYSILSYMDGIQPRSEQRRAIKSLLSDTMKALFAELAEAKMVLSETAPNSSHPGVPYIIKQEEKIISLISTNELDEAKKFADSYIGYILTVYENDPALIRSRIAELIILSGRECIKEGADSGKVLELTHAYTNNLMLLTDVTSMHRLLVRSIENFGVCFEVSGDEYHVQTIQFIKEYINENYYKKITLEEIADLVHLSKSHLSRVINNSMGCRLCTYINSVRVEKSFNFLMDPWLSLSDVAKICGFDGQSYFTKVFKSHTGVSPGRYREMNIKNNK